MHVFLFLVVTRPASQISMVPDSTCVGLRTITPSTLSATLRSLDLPSSISRLKLQLSSRSLLVSLSASSRPITALLRAASLSRRRCIASLLRLLNCATLPWTSEEVLTWVLVIGSRRPTRSPGRDGDCGICWRFARSGEIAKSGVPGEAGKLNFGSIWL